MLLGDLYKEELKRTPDKAALIFRGSITSYAEFDQSVKRTADALLVMNVTRGDRVVLFMHNCVELMEFYFACFRIGAIAVPLNHRYMQDEVVYAVNHCSASILIADDEHFEIVRDLHSRLSSVNRIFAVGSGSGEEEHSWESVAAGAPLGLELPGVRGEDPAIIMYTSGSTSKPKGVTYNHTAIINLCNSRKISMGLTNNDVGLAATAICHCGGSIGMAFPTLYAGGTVIIMETSDPLLFLECVEKYRPTRTLLLPAQLLDVLDASEARDSDFSCFSDVYNGGDYIS
jgi:acyl-coenzyme A synthetase/AMP-(fatty) acid ligase